MQIPDGIKEKVLSEIYNFIKRLFRHLFYFLVWKGMGQVATKVYEKMYKLADEHDLHEETETDFRNIDSL